MASIKDKTTVLAIAREYTSNGRDKAQAMRTIGYAESSCKSGRAVGDVYGNVRIIAAIKAIDDKTEEKLDLSRESQHKKLKEAFDIAKTSKNAAAMTSAIREQNEMLGYHRDKALNPEREASKAQRMTEEERKLALLGAKLRTDEESEVKIVKFRTGTGA